MHESLKDFTIYFAAARPALSEFADNSIVIYPADDAWNDFGYRTLFDFLVIGENFSLTKRFRLGFLEPDSSPVTVVKRALSAVESEFLPADELPHFFSLQFSESAYRDLVEELGADAALRALLSLNDLVAVRRQRPLPEWVENAIQTGVFSMSFMRTSDSFLAYFNAHLIFSKNHERQQQRAPNFFEYSFQLEGFSNPHELEFSFTHDGLLPKRMSVLIGKNGVGKSRTLYELTEAFLKKKLGLTDEEGRFPGVSRLIAVCTPGETETTFPSVPSDPINVEYLRLSALPGEKFGNGGEPLPVVLQQLLRISNADDRDLRWSIFRRSIESILDLDSLTIVASSSLRDGVLDLRDVNAVDSVSLKELSFGREQARLEAAQRLDRSGVLMREKDGMMLPLSSGQLSFIRLAAQLCLHIKNGSLILIDEPETHLHPNLVSEFVSMLNSILEVTESVAIIATHSAYLVREVPTSQIQIIEVDSDNYVFVNRPRLKTFGANVSSISNFIFGDGIINRFIDEVEARIVNRIGGRNLSWEDELQEDLSSEAIMYLNGREKKARRV